MKALSKLRKMVKAPKPARAMRKRRLERLRRDTGRKQFIHQIKVDEGVAREADLLYDRELAALVEDKKDMRLSLKEKFERQRQWINRQNELRRLAANSHWSAGYLRELLKSQRKRVWPGNRKFLHR